MAPVTRQSSGPCKAQARNLGTIPDAHGCNAIAFRLTVRAMRTLRISCRTIHHTQERVRSKYERADGSTENVGILDDETSELVF